MRAKVKTRDPARKQSWAPAHFLALPENQPALLAVQRLVRGFELNAPRCSFVPVLLHGPPGSGKSHLAGQLFDSTARQHQALRQDASDWAGRDFEHVRMARNVDLLIVEDLQHLPAGAADAFATLLDRRVARRQATLLTASHGPAELLNLSGRLASRLVGGLIVAIQPLGVASRREFLSRVAESRRINVGADALDWLAGNLHGSGRQLIAAIDRLQSLNARSAVPSLAEVCAHFQAECDDRRPTVDKIARFVGRQYQVDVKQIRGRERLSNVLWPRQVSMYLARGLTGLSLARIGEYFGRDHSTVRHACEKVTLVVETDADQAGRVRQLEVELAGS